MEIGGMKQDDGKQKWHSLPLVILEPLADVMEAGVKKYAKFNCLERFDNPDERFYNGMMRHVEACQLDPLAIDEETGCYHAAQIAFNTLMRLYHCQRDVVEKPMTATEAPSSSCQKLTENCLRESVEREKMFARQALEKGYRYDDLDK